MPQMGLGKQAAISGLLQGLIGGYGQSQQRQLEQQKKGVEDQIKNTEKTLSLLEKHYPGDPRIDPLVDTLIELRGGTPRRGLTPLQQQRSEFVRGIGPTVTGYREAERIGAPTGPIQPPPAPKAPTAGTIAYARRARDKFQKDIDEANSKIEAMRQRLKLAPGESPKTPAGLGKRKEQTDLDNWNKVNRELATAKASLDSLKKASAGRGIDLEFGAPTPEQVSEMSIEEILRMIGAGGR